MPPITLYGYATSPYVIKVACYLKFKRLPYRFQPVNPVKPDVLTFTGQRQVPVLKVGEDWQKESSEIGWWLDEMFPEPPLDGKDEKASFVIRDIDDWISNTLIPCRFREAVDWEDPWISLHNGWRLAEIVDHGTRLPPHVRAIWPFAVKRAPFIQRMVNQLDRSEPVPQMRERVLDELEAHLGKGPYLGTLKRPSLADLSAYAVLMSGWLMGLHGVYDYRRRPKLLDWMKRVQGHLPDNPLACEDRFIRRPFPWTEGARP